MIQIGDRTYHLLFPDLLRPLNAAELDSLRTSIRERGVCVPVVIDESGGIIDGGNRATLAAELGLDSIPTQLVVGLDDSQKVQLAYQLNETRRQLSQADREEARKNRDRRLARIAAARAEGQSLRAIAETEGVSEKQVRADIKELQDPETPHSDDESAGADHSAPALSPEKVTGKDGKGYPADNSPQAVEGRRQAIAEKLAEGKTEEQVAEEVGVSRRAVQMAKKKLKDTPDEEPGDDQAEADATKKPAGPVDAWGIPIQPHAVEAFASLPQFDELLALLRKAKKLYSALALQEGGKYLQASEVSKCVVGSQGETSRRFVSKGIDAAIKAVEDAQPRYTVCPWEYSEKGHPDDCRTCYGLKWTTEVRKGSVPDSILQRIKEAFGV